MAGQHILLVNEDPDLAGLFQKTLERTGTGLTSVQTTKGLGQQLSKNSFSMVVVQSKKGCFDDLGVILEKGLSKDLFLIIASSHLIKSGLDKIQELSNEIHKDGHKAPTPLTPAKRSVPSNSSRELLLNDFVERKLKDFVKRMTLSQGRNLYSLLIKEVEKPLITLILKETHGNQIQAAQLLGMNRNTLRKKIKELKINFKRTKT